MFYKDHNIFQKISCYKLTISIPHPKKIKISKIDIYIYIYIYKTKDIASYCYTKEKHIHNISSRHHGGVYLSWESSSFPNFQKSKKMVHKQRCELWNDLISNECIILKICNMDKVIWKIHQRKIFQFILIFLMIAKLTNKFAKENIFKYTCMKNTVL